MTFSACKTKFRRCKLRLPIASMRALGAARDCKTASAHAPFHVDATIHLDDVSAAQPPARADVANGHIDLRRLPEAVLRAARGGTVVGFSVLRTQRTLVVHVRTARGRPRAKPAASPAPGPGSLDDLAEAAAEVAGADEGDEDDAGDGNDAGEEAEARQSAPEEVRRALQWLGADTMARCEAAVGVYHAMSYPESRAALEEALLPALREAMRAGDRAAVRVVLRSLMQQGA